MKFVSSSHLLLIGIFFIAFFLRFSGLNWDQGHHLHPDERFVTMVGVAMRQTDSLVQYFGPNTSTFNPANVGYPFFVYGTFPIVLTKLIAIPRGLDTYTDFTLLGRVLSGLFDLLTLYIVFKILSLLQRRYALAQDIPYWGAFFYAIAVLPIQLSHFFAVDTFLTFFATACVYFMLKFIQTKKQRDLAISAALLGLAIGCKVSAIYTFPLLFLLYCKQFVHAKKSPTRQMIVYHLKSFLLFGMVTYLSARIADPYLFQTANFLDITPSTLFLENLHTLQSWSDPEAWFPPGVQWLNKPFLFALINILFFGLGIVYATLSGIGILITLGKKRMWEFVSIIIWMLLLFVYLSLQMSKTMRYFLPLYPFLAIFAALGFVKLTKKWNMYLKTIVIIFVILWPMLFFAIYTKPHTRTTASRWIHQTIPERSILLNEHWDDALPLSGNYPHQKQFVMDEIKVYDPDTPQKWQSLNDQLKKSDYLILSSNRAWGSITTVPERYPKMSAFYEDLLAGKTQYKKIAEFTSYPSLSYLGIPITINDDWAEEAFSVYDHPKVMIFQNQQK